MAIYSILCQNADDCTKAALLELFEWLVGMKALWNILIQTTHKMIFHITAAYSM